MARQRRGWSGVGLSVTELHLRQAVNLWASLVAQAVKNLPAIQETQVPSLAEEDPQRKWQPTLMFLPGYSHGQRWLPTVHGVAKSWTQLSN